ncbi:MAG: hypothetical protein LBN27_05835 [Prevotellaceae bacterium]|jgi:hypothetical protein|nr:hypothetical protein [Prevotellaceae bacterium]
MNKYKTIDLPTAIVEIDDWQMQCCGDPFKVGDIIEWTVLKWNFEKLVVDVGNIDFYYENHADSSAELFKIKGTVKKIVAIHCVYQSKSKKDNTLVPVSGITVDVTEADGWDKDIEGMRFFGYCAYLENANVCST